MLFLETSKGVSEMMLLFPYEQIGNQRIRIVVKAKQRCRMLTKWLFFTPCVSCIFKPFNKNMGHLVLSVFKSFVDYFILRVGGEARYRSTLSGSLSHLHLFTNSCSCSGKVSLSVVQIVLGDSSMNSEAVMEGSEIEKWAKWKFIF